MVERFCRTVSRVNEIIGSITAWLLVPLMVIVMLDVLLRYIIRQPTIWGWDVNVQILAAVSIIGGSYALLHNSHVSVDVLVSRLSARKKAAVDSFTDMLLMVVLSIMVWKFVEEAIHAVSIRMNLSSAFAAPLYYLKALIVVGIFLLLLQLIVKFIQDIRALRSGNSDQCLLA